jgi:hypothetical protein
MFMFYLGLSLLAHDCYSSSGCDKEMYLFLLLNREVKWMTDEWTET